MARVTDYRMTILRTIIEDMDLKITSVTGECNETGNIVFAETEKDDTENIDISCLSLKIDPKQIMIFRQRSQDDKSYRCV